MAHILQDTIEFIINEWNKTVASTSNKKHYEFKIVIGDKDYYINKKEKETIYIAEASLYCKGEKNYLLWRREFELPKKIKGMKNQELINNATKDLCRYFLYEAISSFTLVTERLIETQDICEYDINNNRLMQQPSANQMTVKTIKDGQYFKAGDEFDVFMELDTHYMVYCSIFKKNQGIVRMEKEDCIVTNLPVKKVELIKL
jgi:hypothetical protein